MPVSQPAGQMSSKLVTIVEPYLQRKKRVPLRSDQPVTMKPTMEPALQHKKRVEPVFLKTTPAKSDFDGVPLQSKKRVPSPSHKPTPTEPIMQAKKRVVSGFVKPPPPEPSEDNLLQSKKRVEQTKSEKSIQSEPPLQSKRRAYGPSTTLSNGFYDNGVTKQEEYALLGNQDKFSSNVKYRPKSAYYSRDISPPKQMKLQQKYKENREPSPAPKVNVDQFKKPVTPLAPRKPKPSDPAAKDMKESNVVVEPKVLRSPKQSQSEPKISKSKKDECDMKISGSETKAVQNTEPSTKQQKTESDSKESTVPKDQKVQKSLTTKSDSKASTVPKDQKVQKSSTTKINKVEEASNLNRGDPVKDSMKSKKIIGNMNASAQTNMEKGVADCVAEAPADYALRYKTGISAPRPTKKVSEYQKQFSWKTGPPASPLLKAEQEIGSKQVVYNSNPQLSPPKKSLIPKVTEYQKQYKAYKLVPVPKDDIEVVPQRRTKLQKSKSMEDLSPAEIKPAGSAPVISPENRRLTMETDQKMPEPVPEVPKKKSRLVRSEYKSNFKQPEQFDYLRGSWQGAAPPHVQLLGPEETRKAPVIASWFAEVIELRRKAQEYRKRALGTHFSREHMAQLLAKQNDLWEDTSTTPRSTLSALSLESGLSSHRGQYKSGKVHKIHFSTAATLASEDDQSTARLEEVNQQNGRPEKRQAWEDEGVDDSRETPSSMSVESHNGHVQLREQIEASSSQHRRHHLDRTTPTVGGAILSSPPDGKKKRSGKRIVSRSVDSISLATAESETPRVQASPEHRPLAGQKTYTLSANQGTIQAAPTQGMPSRDTHILRDDDASTDRSLHTKFVYTPALDRETPAGLSVIDEGYGQTYNKSKPLVKDYSWTMDGGLPVPRIDEDDDVLSVSMQSIASSCSLASATLERARKRKDDFWGQSTVKAK